MVIILIPILIIASAVLISLGIAGQKTPLNVELPKPALDYTPKLKRSGRTSILSYLLPFTPWLMEKTVLGVSIKRRIDAAHIRMNPAEFFNFKIAFMVLLPVMMQFLSRALAMPVFIFVFALIGFFLPDFYLKQKINKRRRLIVKQLPEIVDLIGLCIEAGLDFNSALRWVVEKVPTTPLIEEFTFMLEEIKWGKARSQALKDMSRRLNITEVNSLVLTLSQAERMGTPVAEAFTILSEDSRSQRFHRGERIALKAPIKILIPLIFCILPVIAIIVGAPIMLQFMQGDVVQGFGSNLEGKVVK